MVAVEGPAWTVDTNYLAMPLVDSSSSGSLGRRDKLEYKAFPKPRVLDPDPFHIRADSFSLEPIRSPCFFRS